MTRLLLSMLVALLPLGAWAQGSGDTASDFGTAFSLFYPGGDVSRAPRPEGGGRHGRRA